MSGPNYRDSGAGYSPLGAGLSSLGSGLLAILGANRDEKQREFENKMKRTQIMGDLLRSGNAPGAADTENVAPPPAPNLNLGTLQPNPSPGPTSALAGSSPQGPQGPGLSAITGALPLSGQMKYAPMAGQAQADAGSTQRTKAGQFNLGDLGEGFGPWHYDTSLTPEGQRIKAEVDKENRQQSADAATTETIRSNLAILSNPNSTDEERRGAHAVVASNSPAVLAESMKNMSNPGTITTPTGSVMQRGQFGQLSPLFAADPLVAQEQKGKIALESAQTKHALAEAANAGLSVATDQNGNIFTVNKGAGTGRKVMTPYVPEPVASGAAGGLMVPGQPSTTPAAGTMVPLNVGTKAAPRLRDIQTRADKIAQSVDLEIHAVKDLAESGWNPAEHVVDVTNANLSLQPQKPEGMWGRETSGFVTNNLRNRGGTQAMALATITRSVAEHELELGLLRGGAAAVEQRALILQASPMALQGAIEKLVQARTNPASIQHLVDPAAYDGTTP